MGFHYINGLFGGEEAAKVSLSDLGMTRGMAVNDIFRTYGKRPFHLEEHLTRLKTSAVGLALELPKEWEQLEQIIEKVIHNFEGEECCLRTIVTAGESAHRFLPEGKPSLFVSALPLITFPKEHYEKGAGVCTTHFERPFPRCKTLFYGGALKALREGARYHPFEALLVSSAGELLEGLTSNFFAVVKGRLITAHTDKVLAGVTRSVVLSLAEGLLPIDLRPLKLDELNQIDEAFLTSCTKEVMPVTSIDGAPVGQGRVGPYTKKLKSAFHIYTQKAALAPAGV